MRKNFLYAFALCLPMLVFFAGYLFNHSKAIQPTGFIQYDNVSYIAYAKQYTDADKFHLQYSNPFNDSDDYRPIYFQIQTLFFAFLLKAGVPPGWILIPFTIICTLICFLLLIRIYDFVMPNPKNRTFNTWLFAWGGGLLTLAGIVAHYILKREGSVTDDLFLIDPEKGWWGLSFGRSLFFSCEAYNHALFLGCIYALLRRKYILAIVLLFLLSVSHPFTGLELAAIVCAWCAFEFLLRKNELPIWFALASLAVLSFHLYYYLVYLEQFPDHRSVSEQYTLTWRLGIYRIIPAYCIVGTLAIVSMYNASLKKFLAIRPNRIFLCWFLIAFLLANHEVFMQARQPIHFTRGYIWTSLFLLGLPALQQFNVWLKNKYKVIGLAVFAFVFLFDNFIWITGNAIGKATSPYITYITPEQKQIFQALDQSSTNHTLIISNDNSMAYLSSVYTKAYPWYSHPYTTPFAATKSQIQNLFFTKGVFDSAWSRRHINFILRKEDTTALSALERVKAKKILETSNYLIYSYNP